ncbi:PTS system transporter subunit IIBC [Streptococcus pneumoniae]|nr:PTS system transporter subunit IIBC [Streptococcus pneumoniae]CWL71554.1 PTS system transporter subunit IIBC [Streptococcus pneumoniae]
MFKVLQKVGKAFMLPIAILPAAGLLLGIGGALSNPTTIATYPILDNSRLVRNLVHFIIDDGTN